MDQETLRDTVISVLERAEKLQENPQFYNSLYRNCTTGLLPMLPGAMDLTSGDIRVLLNGLAVQLLFEKDMVVRRDIALDVGVVPLIENPSAVEQRFGSRLQVNDSKIASCGAERDACCNGGENGGQIATFHSCVPFVHVFELADADGNIT